MSALYGGGIRGVRGFGGGDGGGGGDASKLDSKENELIVKLLEGLADVIHKCRRETRPLAPASACRNWFQSLTPSDRAEVLLAADDQWLRSGSTFDRSKPFLIAGF